MKIIDFLLDSLVANDVNRIFGNPGTTEIPLVAACEKRADVKYIVCLSEIAAVPMADGYARATRSLGVVNLHVAPGLGNGMGALYTAGIVGSPLLVLVGGQDRRFLHTNPILWGPVEQMASSVCKEVYTLHTEYDAAGTIRRALRSAITSPYAPVALICPPDLMEVEIDSNSMRVIAPKLGGLVQDDVERYADLLTEARNPAFIAAEDVYWNDASIALEKIATVLQAPVYVAPYTGVLPISSASSCYAGFLPPSFSQMAERLSKHDMLLYVGGRGLRTTLYSEARLTSKTAWLGNNASAIPSGDEHQLSCVANIQSALSQIEGRLSIGRSKAPDHLLRPELNVPPSEENVLHPTRAIQALLRHFQGAMWVDESGLSTSDVRQWMQLHAGEYLINGSGGIGWGVPAAVGVALGRPDRTVIAISGDGSSLYASEAMWTAENRGTAILLIILSNRRYATLNAAAGKLLSSSLSSFTIEPPVLDFSGLAHLYGWAYARTASEQDLEDFIRNIGQKPTRNTLLEIILDPDVKPITANRHF